MLNSVVDSSQFVARPAICGFVESGHAPDFDLQCVGNIYFEGEKKPPAPQPFWPPDSDKYEERKANPTPPPSERTEEFDITKKRNR